MMQRWTSGPMMNRKSFLKLLIGIAAGLPAFWRRSPALAGTAVDMPRNDWDSVDFQADIGGKVYPGIAIKLPDNEVDVLFVACKICPHQGCEFGYEKNFSLVGDIVGKDFSNPILFCRCHMSVYDPAQKGKVLNGPAPRPPWTFSFSAKAGKLDIEGVEEGVGTFGS